MQNHFSISGEEGGLIQVQLVRIAAASMFIIEGGLKLFGTADIIRVFEVIGCGQWLRYSIGGMEVISGIALLIPRLAISGMTTLMIILFGAFFTHLFVLGSSPMESVLLLVVLMIYSRVRQESESGIHAMRACRRAPLRISWREGKKARRNSREHRLAYILRKRQI